MPGTKKLAILLWAIILASFCARGWFIVHDEVESQQYNSDALEHMLVTWQCLNETPVSESYFLPLYTYADETNKGINDLPDAAVSDSRGNYYYISFPPLSFALPSLLLTKTLGIAPSSQALRLFSLSIHAIVVALSYLIVKCATTKPNDNHESHFWGTAIALSLAFAPEFIVSFTFNYWAQHVYLLLFLLQYIAYSKNKMSLFYSLCFLGCLTEWTAYIANLGWTISLFFAKDENGISNKRTSALTVLFVTAFGLAALVFWYSLVTTPAEYFTLLTHRQGFRSTSSSSLLKLPYFYGSSLRIYILFAPFVCISAYQMYRNKTTLQNSQAHSYNLKPLIFVTAFSLIENIVVLGHAANYSYDRLKGVYLVCLLATLTLPMFRQKFVSTIFIAICLASGVDQYFKVFANYHEQKHSYLNADFARELQTIHAENKYPIIANVDDVPCRVIATTHANIFCYPTNRDRLPQQSDFDKLATLFTKFEKSIVCWHIDNTNTWYFYILKNDKTWQQIKTLELSTKS